MRIAVAGTGYVGLSIAVLLAREHDVVAVDIVPERIGLINRGRSPLADPDIEALLARRTLKLTATQEAAKGYRDADFVVVAVPTNYDTRRNSFDTSAVESVIQQVLEVNPQAVIVIKSTVPIGYTVKVQKMLSCRILFSPEFLREGHALHDLLYPSRIIVGFDQTEPDLQKEAETFASLMEKGAIKENVPILLMGSMEAEAVKLFTNAYLAMRVGFFNELDTYAETMELDVRQIISGICLEPRVGMQYNNPSFGYGGYCFPKDVKQVLANYGTVPQCLMRAIVETNEVRKEYISTQILHRISGLERAVVGIYRLTMKAGSDNFRQSAIQDVMKNLRSHGIRMVVYEPNLGHAQTFENCLVENCFQRFAEICDVIVANRYDPILDSVKEKVYTRDVFQRD